MVLPFELCIAPVSFKCAALEISEDVALLVV